MVSSTLMVAIAEVRNVGILVVFESGAHELG
jgi:hypothetical protein